MDQSSNNHRVKWFAEPVSEYSGSVECIKLLIPSFERRSFKAAPASAENEFLDQVVRRKDEKMGEMAVGIVSKKYGLVQHTDLYEASLKALLENKIALEKVQAELSISKYGTRMRLGFTFPQEYAVDMGDGYPIAPRLECFNSVDGSCRLWILMGWLRFVCQNGLVIGSANVDLRKRHSGTLNLNEVGPVLRGGMSKVKSDVKVFQRWRDKCVGRDDLIKWVNSTVRERWGVLAAARAYLICETGYDGCVADPFVKGLPHEKQMRPTTKVPGAVAPARNVYDISQALAWLAKERRDIEDQRERVQEIPEMMVRLMN